MADTVFSGYLTKHKGRGKRSMRRWFVLDTRSISYFDSRDESLTSKPSIASIDFINIRDFKKGGVSLDGKSIAEHYGGSRGFSFLALKVKFKGKEKSNHEFVLSADEEEEEEEWMAAFKLVLPPICYDKGAQSGQPVLPAPRRQSIFQSIASHISQQLAPSQIRSPDKQNAENFKDVGEDDDEPH